MSAAGFMLAIADVRVDHSKNPRLRRHYEAGTDEHGAETSSLQQLAESMRLQGQLHNCGVRKSPKGGWELAFGFRRVEAARKLGWSHLRFVEVVDACAPLAENMGPKKLLAVEVALECHRLRTHAQDRSGRPLTATGIARRAGVSEKTVGNYDRLVRLLHPSILSAWTRTPGGFSVRDLLAVCMRSQAEQLAWFHEHGAIIVEESVDEDGEPREGGGRKKRRLTARRLIRFLRDGNIPEIDRMAPRAAALHALGLLDKPLLEVDTQSRAPVQTDRAKRTRLGRVSGNVNRQRTKQRRMQHG